MEKLAKIGVVNISAIFIGSKYLRQRIKIAVKILRRIARVNILVLGIRIARLNKLFGKAGRRKRTTVKLFHKIVETINRRIELKTIVILDKLINKIAIPGIIRNGRSIFRNGEEIASETRRKIRLILAGSEIISLRVAGNEKIVEIAGKRNGANKINNGLITLQVFGGGGGGGKGNIRNRSRSMKTQRIIGRNLVRKSTVNGFKKVFVRKSDSVAGISKITRGVL